MRGLTAALFCIFLTACLGADKVMSSADRQLMTRGTQRSLDANKNGESFNWTAADEGHHGTITPLETYQTASGRPCRRYRQTLSVAGGRTSHAEDTACRRANGRWYSINVRAPAGHASFASRRRRDGHGNDYAGGALFGLFYGLGIVAIHHAGGLRHFRHRWRSGITVGHAIRIGG